MEDAEYISDMHSMGQTATDNMLFPDLEVLRNNPEQFVNLADSKLSLSDVEGPESDMNVDVIDLESDSELVGYLTGGASHLNDNHLSPASIQSDGEFGNENVDDDVKPELPVAVDLVEGAEEPATIGNGTMSVSIFPLLTSASLTTASSAMPVVRIQQGKIFSPSHTQPSITNRCHVSLKPLILSKSSSRNFSDTDSDRNNCGKENSMSKTNTVRPVSLNNGHVIPAVVRPQRVSSTSSMCEVSQSGQCMTKTAIAARENRERKKNYLNTLERSVSNLTGENKTLKKNVTCMQKEIGDLRTEVQYLRNVLANQSTLSTLLKNVCSSPGVEFITPELNNNDDIADTSDSMKRRASEDLDIKEDLGVEENVQQLQSGGALAKARKVQKLDHDYTGDIQPKFENLKRSKKGFPSQMKRRFQVRDKTCSDTGSAGVCLHVANNKVSLEFCPTCSNKASVTRQKRSRRD